MQVLSENQFITLMDLKTTAREWQAIECIQTCTKAKGFSFGKHLPINFSMQVDMEEQRALKKQLSSIDIKTTLDYNFREIGSEYEPIITEEAFKLMISLTPSQVQQQVDAILMELRPRDFCLKQVLKMCFFLQKV